MTMDVSAYSLVALARHAAPLLEVAGGGSIMSMSYLGAARVGRGWPRLPRPRRMR